MSVRTITVRHLFGGGWARDLGPSAEVAITPGGSPNSGFAMIPFLWDAENVMFELDGGPRKMGGTIKLNSIAVGPSKIKGLFDYWRFNGTTAVQNRIVHVGRKLYKEDTDGVFDEIATGLELSSIPNYATYEDLCIVMSTADVPRYYDQTSVELLGVPSGNTPNFSFGVVHKNRFWASGEIANPSRVYYSPSLLNGGANGDWDDDSSGYIDVDPNDGDKVNAVWSYKNDLWVFKGPYRGSIHRIVGSAPTGSDGFGRVPFISKGLGAVGQNSMFTFMDDVGFMWIDGSVHSLKATSAFGDYNEVALSRPINNELARRVNTSELEKAWSANDVSRGCVYITVAMDSGTANNNVLCMDYRFNPVRWSLLSALDAACLASVIDSANNDAPVVMMGSNDSFVKKINQPNRSLDGVTSIPAKVTTPSLSYGDAFKKKGITRASIGIQPKGNYNMTFAWTNDEKTQQSTTVSQAGSDALGGTVLFSRTFIATSDSVFDPGVKTTVAGLGVIGDPNVAALEDGVYVTIVNTANYNGYWPISNVTKGAFAYSFDIPVVHSINENGGWNILAESPPFVLGTSTLAGATFIDRFMKLDTGGSFRYIQYQMSQNVNNQDMEVHSFSAVIKERQLSGEN